MCRLGPDMVCSDGLCTSVPFSSDIGDASPCLGVWERIQETGRHSARGGISTRVPDTRNLTGEKLVLVPVHGELDGRAWPREAAQLLPCRKGGRRGRGQPRDQSSRPRPVIHFLPLGSASSQLIQLQTHQ